MKIFPFFHIKLLLFAIFFCLTVDSFFFFFFFVLLRHRFENLDPFPGRLRNVPPGPGRGPFSFSKTWTRAALIGNLKAKLCTLPYFMSACLPPTTFRFRLWWFFYIWFLQVILYSAAAAAGNQCSHFNQPQVVHVISRPFCSVHRRCGASSLDSR